MSNFQFTVAKNPFVTRYPVIKVDGKSNKLMMRWKRPTSDEAADLVDEITEMLAPYIDSETGEPVVAMSEGQSVERRTMRETLQVQRDFMRRMVVGFPVDEETEPDEDEELHGLLLKWGLMGDDGEPLDFKDDAVFDMVFAESDYLLPVINDFTDMLGDIAIGRDRAKNSKTSGRGGRGRKGKLRT